jgi:hypothetical protein
MTANTVIRAFNAVHVLSDTGVFDNDGRLVGVTTKVWPMPHKSLVVCVRGHALICSGIAGEIARLGSSYEELRAIVRSEFRSSFQTQSEFMRGKGVALPELKFDVVIAGYSEREGPHSYAFSNYDMAADCPAWSEIGLGPIAPLPSTNEMMARLNLPGVEALSIERDGLRIANEQRRLPMPFPTGTPGCGVGGSLVLTTITTQMITQRIIHRWPDKIGERINP